MFEAPSVLDVLRIMIKLLRIMIEALHIMLETPIERTADHLRQLWLSI